MCGRYVQTVPFGVLAEWLGGTFETNDVEVLQPRWNISPTSTVVAMRLEHDERVIGHYRWGLVGPWAKELPKFPTHNARAETVATKPTFRRAFESRRAIVPADAYYEWQVLGSGSKPDKQPWLIGPANDIQLAFAGLYEFWRPPYAAKADRAARRRTS